MKTKSIYLFILAAALCWACGGKTDRRLSALDCEGASVKEVFAQDVKEIDIEEFVEKDEFPFEQLVSEVRTIKLETDSKSVLGGIYKVIVTESNVYVYDNFKGGSVAIFSSAGAFVKRLSRGNGPGEIHRVWDVDYDYQMDELCVYQHPFLLFYDKNGVFLREARLPFGFYNFKVTSTGYVFKTINTDANQHMGDFGKYSLFMTDKQMRLTHAALPDIVDINFVDHAYLTNCEDKLFVTQPFDDNVYSLSANGELVAEYKLKYDSHHIDTDRLRGSRSEAESCLRETKGYYHLGKHLETSGHSLFFIQNNLSSCAVYRNKHTGEMSGGRIQCVAQDKMPPVPFPAATFGDYFVSVLAPYPYKPIVKGALLSDKDIENISSMKEDDNPVLVLFKLGGL